MSLAASTCQAFINKRVAGRLGGQSTQAVPFLIQRFVTSTGCELTTGYREDKVPPSLTSMGVESQPIQRRYGESVNTGRYRE
jgi:hypothetical protein